MTNDVMCVGKVKWFDDAKGFGFIECAELAGQDVFVHYRQIDQDGRGRRTLLEGQAVEFSYEPGPKGLKATRVIPV